MCKKLRKFQQLHWNAGGPKSRDWYRRLVKRQLNIVSLKSGEVSPLDLLIGTYQSLPLKNLSDFLKRGFNIGHWKSYLPEPLDVAK